VLDPNTWWQSFSALTLLVGRQEGHPACKNIGGMVKVGTGWSGWSGAQPDGRCLPLLIFPCTIKSRGFLLAPAHPGRPGKRAVKWLCVDPNTQCFCDVPVQCIFIALQANLMKINLRHVTSY